MKTTSSAVTGLITPDLQEKEADELHLNAFRTASLRRKLNEGRGWEGALVGLVREILSPGETTGQPGWTRYRFQDTSTTFEFESFAEWITDPNGLATSAKHLIELLEISPDEEGRALADQVRQELKLPEGRPSAETPNNVRSLAGELQAAQAGNSAAGVRRKIRNWIKANPGDPNHGLAQQWLAKLEANPKSRLHQQALREIGIGGERKKLLDVSGVSDTLLDRLHALARDEGIAVAELIEDALAVYFRMEEEPGEEVIEAAPAPTPPAPQPPAAVPGKSNGHSISISEMTHLPEPGFYGATELCRLLGRNHRSISSLLAKTSDGGEIWQQVLAQSPIRVFVRKNREPDERLEVVAK